jgi:hypothetical protein
MSEDEFDPDLRVTIEAFGHTFKDLFPGKAEDLRSLEREGAIYSEFADRDSDGEFQGTFTRYRIRFTPSEIYEYVEAHIAEQQFNEAQRSTGDFTAAVLAVRDEKYRKRVTEYGEYGTRKDASGNVFDIRGCLASFLSDDLEALVCGVLRERYEVVPELGNQSNQDELVLKCLKSITTSVRKLGDRSHGREPFIVENEYDVQDLIETVLRGTFPEVVREEWTTKRAGSAKRIDLVIRSLGILVECKYVRDTNHAKKIADELRIDFECYHDYPDCRQLYVYVYDPDRLIDDPENFAADLNGVRRKRDHEFSVEVIVG